MLPINPQNIAVYNICSVLFSGSKAAVILEEEMLHKNVLQDVKKLTTPSYCQPGDFTVLSIILRPNTPALTTSIYGDILCSSKIIFN